jgi:hypothetical protein
VAWAPIFTDGKPLFIEREGILAPAWAEEPCDTDCCPEDPPPPLNCTPCLNVTIAGLPLWTSNDGLFQADYRPLNGGYQLALGGGQGSTCCTWGTTVSIPIPGTGGSVTQISATCCNGEAFVFFNLSSPSPIFQLSADPAATVGNCPTGFSHPLDNGYQLVGPPVGGTATATPANCTPPPECIPPTVAFVNTPPATTTSTTATFTWSTTGTVGATSLKLDGGMGMAPISPGSHTYQFLTPGPHTVEITVLSLGGCGNASASYTWNVEGPPPECFPPTVGFTSVPPLSTQSTTATFQWATTGTVALTAIRLDDLPFTNPSGSNTHTYSNVSVGTHTVTLQVQAPCGTASDSYTWTVTSPPPECIPPTVTLTQTPPATTTSTSATFNWTTTGTVVLQFVRIDGGSLINPSGNNTHTFNNLAPGVHQFEVQVQSGQCGNASAFFTWEVTTPCTPPQVTFTQAPPDPTISTTATFTWTTTGTATTTTLKLDGGAPVTPSSPGTNTHVFNNLPLGTHVVEITVTSPCGNATDTHIWRIDAPANLCEKIFDLLNIQGTSASIDAEITFSGASVSGCIPPGYNRTFLLPGPRVLAAACPDVHVCEMITTQVCGTLLTGYADQSWVLCPRPGQQFENQPTLSWLICTTCTSAGGVSGPQIRVRVSYPFVDGRQQFADFRAVGTAQVETLVDQMLATGSCVVPFHSQVNPPGFQQFNFAGATCTLRILLA